MSYIPDSDPRLIRAQQTLQAAFEHGTLHSRSKAGEILSRAMDALADEGLPRRKSLALMIGRRAQTWWVGQIQACKAGE